jgi:hypothetical protein
VQDESKKKHKNIHFLYGKTAGENETVDVLQKEDTTQKKKGKRKWKEIHDSQEAEDNTGENVETKTVEKVEGFTVIGTHKFKKRPKVCLYQTNYVVASVINSIFHTRLINSNCQVTFNISE